MRVKVEVRVRVKVGVRVRLKVSARTPGVRHGYTAGTCLRVQLDCAVREQVGLLLPVRGEDLELDDVRL